MHCFVFDFQRHAISEFIPTRVPNFIHNICWKIPCLMLTLIFFAFSPSQSSGELRFFIPTPYIHLGSHGKASQMLPGGIPSHPLSNLDLHGSHPAEAWDAHHSFLCQFVDDHVFCFNGFSLGFFEKYANSLHKMLNQTLYDSFGVYTPFSATNISSKTCNSGIFHFWINSSVRSSRGRIELLHLDIP